MNQQLEKFQKSLNRVPSLVWIIIIVIILALSISINRQQAEKLPLSQPAGLYQSDTAVSAKIYYNAQLLTDGSYEISRVERQGDGSSAEAVISKGVYTAMPYGYLMEESATGKWQAITLDHTGFYWTDQELDQLTHFNRHASYGTSAA